MSIEPYCESNDEDLLRAEEAVFAVYGWPADLTDEQILERLLELNLAQAAGQAAAPAAER